ncbi:hypothetical protein HPB47_012776, partial [Ixodes persulcatus]
GGAGGGAGGAGGGSVYKTAYACEGSQLSFACPEGQLIALIRANYGRFSISICNEHGTLDWSVDCKSNRSYNVIRERCHLNTSCRVLVDSLTFGDPCPGTFKYLEVQFRCQLDTQTPLLRVSVVGGLSGVSYDNFEHDAILDVDNVNHSAAAHHHPSHAVPKATRAINANIAAEPSRAIHNQEHVRRPPHPILIDNDVCNAYDIHNDVCAACSGAVLCKTTRSRTEF